MAELPKLNPSVNIQPSGGVAPRNQVDVAGQDIQSGYSSLTTGIQAIAKFRDDEAINAGRNAAADEHITLLGRVSQINASTPDPAARQSAYQALGKEYTSPERLKRLQDTYGVKGAQAFQAAFQPHFVDTLSKEFGHAETARQEIYKSNVFSLADKELRDAVNMGYGSTGFNEGMKQMAEHILSANPMLIPNREELVAKAIDKAFLMTGVQEATTNPRSVIDRLAKSTRAGGRRSLEYTINGETRNVVADPMTELSVTQAAMHALNFTQAQADHTLSIDLKKLAVQREKVESSVTLAIVQDKPEVYYQALNMLDVQGRVLLDGSAQRSLYHFKEAVDKAKREGPKASDPAVYGKAVTDIENLRLMNPLAIMGLPELTFDDRKSLVASALGLNHKMKDADYAAGRNRRKEAEDFIRGVTNAKDPATSWGIVNPQHQVLITQYRQRADEIESRMQAQNSSWAGYQPMQIATKLVEESSDLFAKDFKQQAKTIMHTLERFIPPSGQITFPRVRENIVKDTSITANERLMFLALTTQMQKQGITTQQIETRIYGPDAQDDTQQANWVLRLLQGASKLANP